MLYIYYSQLCGYSPDDLLALILRQMRSVLPQDHSRMARQIPKPTEEGHLDNLATTGCIKKHTTYVSVPPMNVRGILQATHETDSTHCIYCTVQLGRLYRQQEDEIAVVGHHVLRQVSN